MVNSQVMNALSLNDLDVALDEHRCRMATKEEIQKLCEFIGGFEKWPMLNEDCRNEIIKFMDYKSKCKLSFCSKTDYEIVSKVRERVYRIEISENTDKYYYQKNRIYENVLVNIQFDSDKESQNYIEVVFSQLEEDSEVQWVKYDEKGYPINRHILIKSSNFYEEAAKFFEKWMKKCNCEIHEIRVKMKNYPIESSQIKSLPKCKAVDFQLDDVDHFRWWFLKLPEELSVIHLAGIKNGLLVYPQDILSSTQVMNTKFFFFWGPAPFTDEQFLKLKANNMSFDSVHVTDDGINQYLQNWINGKGVEGLKQVRVFKVHSELRVLRGIDAWKWTQDFEYENRIFCYEFKMCFGIGPTYQIENRENPSESMSICFANNCVSMCVTGKKTYQNGETTTEYKIPK